MTAALVRVASTTFHQPRRVRVGVSALVFVFTLLTSWVVTAAVAWDGVVESANELGYLVADMTLLVPLGAAIGVGLLRKREWAAPLLLVGLGAAAYAAVHLTVYMIRERFLDVPGPVYGAAVVVLLILLGLLARVEIVELEEGAK